MGQTVFWPNFGPITTDFDETRGDFLPPMRPRPWSGSRGRAGPNLEILGWRGGGEGGGGKNSIFGPPGPRDPLQILGRIGGRKSPLVSSKSVVIGPKFGQKTVWPMYALVYPATTGGVTPLQYKRKMYPKGGGHPPKSLKINTTMA